MSKTSAIVRLVIWSLVLILISGLFIASLAGATILKGRINMGFSYDNEESYYVGNHAEYTEKIESIDVNWIDGSVNVEVYEGDIVIVDDTYDGEDDFYIMRSKVENNKLQIKYCASGINIFSKPKNKQLTVKIPESYANLREISVSTVSASSSISGVCADKYDLESVSAGMVVNIPETSGDEVFSAKELNCENVSGSIEVSGSAKRVNVDIVSGSIYLTGTFDKVDVNDVSGRVSLDIEKAFPTEMDIETVSGSVELKIKEDVDLADGFSVNMDSVSGRISLSKAGEIIKYSKYYSYGEGKNKIDIDTVSGNFKIIMP